ncbi:MAG: hypothetical protein P8Y99_11660 [Calditrichaceae bacterium]
MFHKVVIFFMFLMLSIYWSCGSNSVIQRNYVLEYNSATENDEHFLSECSSYPYVVRVDRFNISKVYDQDRIALRTKSNEIVYYYYNIWAENPSTAIRYFIWDKIKAYNFFKATVLNDIDLNSQFVTSGTINLIERVAYKNKHAAHIKMILEFIDQNSGKTLVIYTFDRSSDIEENANMNIFAREISRILDEECNNFIKMICSQLNEDR